MLDFMKSSYRETKSGKGTYEIYPKFIAKSSSDLMIRGSDFYAIWNEEEQMWSTKEETALMLIDKELEAFVPKFHELVPDAKSVKVMYMWDTDTKMIDKWHLYTKKQAWDNFHPLDENLIFSNTVTKKEDYASKRLPYPLEECDISAYEELISTLYSPEERRKIEWAIGSVVSGDSKVIQKFIVMYGAPKTGKSTILKIMEKLFDGYWTAFDSKALGSATNMFSLEAFKSNPLVAIQHDGDLSRIEDNTRLNSLVSHEEMLVNEKFKSAYSVHFNSFLFMGTNKPVKITDSKSGIIRRLIDVSPSGKKVPRADYDRLMAKINFELGGIAFHCLNVYLSDPKIYDEYVPTQMIGASNDFYNYVLDSYNVFKRDDGVTLKAAWEKYNEYCDRARVPYRYQQRVFKEELKSYFKEFVERGSLDGESTRVWNVYKGFIADKFVGTVFDSSSKEEKPSEKEEPKKEGKKLVLSCTVSLLDKECAECPAQYGNDEDKPYTAWDKVKTKLKDILTSKVHYVRVPENHIVIDFDIQDKEGNKLLEKNLEAASKWPATYAELSKSGTGVHLHYIYNGDVTKLSAVYDENIEVKVFTGKSSLRRRLTFCNDIPIRTISSGLPLKPEKKVVDFEGLKNEKAIRTVVKKCLMKEYPPNATVTNVKFLKKVLDDCYANGMVYDVSDMEKAVISFAGRSNHHAQECLALVPQMKFKSEEKYDNFEGYESDEIVIFDFEVFPNGYLISYKPLDKEAHVIRNPNGRFLEELGKFRLVGHNVRKYDNHIAVGIILGDGIPEVFDRSKRLTSNDYTAYIGSAWNYSWADTFDFPAKKQSLKKWEIELGEHHQELGLKWDEPVQDDMWDKVAEYCINDVVATEALWKHLQSDFLAREIQADLAEGAINDTTNGLSAKMIFGNNKNPQSEFRYRNLAEPVFSIDPEMENFLVKNFPEMMAERHGEAQSILPYFPGYTFDISRPKDQRSEYRGHYAGEGGFVWAKRGMYTNVITFDVASMHPHSITSEYLFGKYTDIFNELMEARIAIKHKDFERAGKMFDGKLAKYLTKDSNPKALSNALKIVINSVYGLTAQAEKDGYKSPFRDTRNKDNIVAKRGALFMIDLLEAVTERGGEVIHIKTDSIKVSNPTKELQNYIFNFGKRYGYTFEIEHKFEKICLVNDAVYIAKCSADDEDSPGQWTATGTQFAVPYVFKTLFSKEPIIFDDYCETKSVAGDSAIYLDMIEGLPEGEHNYQFVGRVGQFTPVLPGRGGGALVRIAGEKISALSGTKDYLWLESEYVRDNHLEDAVNKEYYRILADKAIDKISEFGDFEWFVS